MSQYDSIEQKASCGIGRNMGDQLAQQAFAGLDIPAPASKVWQMP